jgi:hypothetical protein
MTMEAIHCILNPLLSLWHSPAGHWRKTVERGNICCQMRLAVCAKSLMRAATSRWRSRMNPMAAC